MNSNGGKPVVVLLGMHRSGTSLSMSMLHALGVECGGSLIPAGPGNETGFWEHAGIVAAQEDLLAAIGRVWHGPNGTHPYPEGWLESDAAKRARERLTRIVAQEMASAERPWGFKDPRTARLLPLWELVFADAGAAPSYILATREPVAVCNSLAKRNGMDRARGLLVWLLYNLDALHDAGDSLKLVVDYDQIVEDPVREAERMAGALGSVMQVEPERIDEAAARVSDKMRRYGRKERTVENAIARDVLEGLDAMAADAPATDGLNRILSTYRDMQELFSPWVRDTRSPLFDWAIRLMLRRKYR